MATCIITGAGSGIGRATACEMSERSDYDTIVLIGRNVNNLNETKSAMNKDKNIYIKPFDLLNLNKIPELVKEIAEQCNSIDCLLNIGGYAEPQALLTTSLESFYQTYETNVFAPFMLIKESVKYMKRNKETSKILNVASTAGITARPGWLSYASSKASVVSLSQTLAEELAEYKIKVYCVSPGRCATDLRKKLVPGEDPSTIMQPNAVGNIICNLVADDEQCLDGQNIVIRRK